MFCQKYFFFFKQINRCKLFFFTVTKVHNPSGPLLNCDQDSAVKKGFDFSCSAGQKSDIQERISNLEKCLNINSNKSNIEIYEKLKSIEDHVLQIESMLLKNSNNISLSNIFQNIQQMEVINHNCNDSSKVNF